MKGKVSYNFSEMFLTCRFALGDARRPLHETAALVEDIVHTQLINLVSVNISRLGYCGI